MSNPETQINKKTERLDYLDSIRGIAAFIVVLHHCLLLNTDSFRDIHHNFSTAFASLPDLLLYILSRTREAGRSCVIIFFVLSGFVLAFSLLRKHTEYRPYAIKRIFRIYPTFLFVIVASYLLHLAIGNPTGVRDGFSWLEEINNPDLSLSAFMKHLALFGTARNMNLDAVMWSLVHEMRISLVFPFILISITRYRWWALISYFMLSVFCSLWFMHINGVIIQGYNADTFAQTLLNTAYFIVFFAAGAFLALEREKIAKIFSSLPVWVHLILFALIICCLLKSDQDTHNVTGNIVDYMRGIAATGLIALALGSGKLREALSHAILTWLGRISYSLYLVHVPILYVVNQTFGKSWSALQAGTTVVILSLIAAELTARFIEFPSIALGKRICDKLQGPERRLP